MRRRKRGTAFSWVYTVWLLLRGDVLTASHRAQTQQAHAENGEGSWLGASGRGHATEALKPVAYDGAAGVEVPPRERGNRLAGESFDTAELDPNGLALWCRFDRRDEG